MRTLVADDATKLQLALYAALDVVEAKGVLELSPEQAERAMEARPDSSRDPFFGLVLPFDSYKMCVVRAVSIPPALRSYRARASRCCW
jgi:hypothetical protein